MDKIAIVVQRYGLEVNGGAEAHARLLANHLNGKYDVEVLTTTAKDYTKWEEYYNIGDDVIEGVKVKRFKTIRKKRRRKSYLGRILEKDINSTKSKSRFKELYHGLIQNIFYRKMKRNPRLLDEWIIAQGPYVPEMIEYIESSKDKYDAFIFFTYLYYPTYAGMPKVGHKSIFIPTAHDEPFFYYKGMLNLFYAPKFIMFNSIAEKELVSKEYPQIDEIETDVAGVGFDKVNFVADHFKPDYRYLLYIGRIDASKGCEELLNFFFHWKSLSTSDLKLVMIGNNILKNTPVSDDIIFTGFIDEQDKYAYLNNCEALVIPSRFESLSMVTLEAMAMGKPVLATGYSAVLKSHIEISQAGLLYKEKDDFVYQVNEIQNLSERDKEIIAEKGREYVESNYSWPIVVNKFDKAIDFIKKTNAR
ncbi:glycosyltransferase family 4 protein [Dysgonomonas sp. Marseille-P4361]|uniref:glycosyltransferase family 4 protein n=1 Tax=Dysgonomonas sp. Marseille-P4361 TaxID=2161820 RepID=UPI000D55B739|nr:glycosyltransferase family 4 protein [Dysgonomonas sp. Marseille-P4361]